MEKQLFLGDEAIAQAAIDAGISGVYAYPGTPSTEIPNSYRVRPSQRKGVFTAVGARMKKLQWKQRWV